MYKAIRCGVWTAWYVSPTFVGEEEVFAVIREDDDSAATEVARFATRAQARACARRLAIGNADDGVAHEW